jgi:hypothetical protein
MQVVNTAVWELCFRAKHRVFHQQLNQDNSTVQHHDHPARVLLVCKVTVTLEEVRRTMKKVPK